MPATRLPWLVARQSISWQAASILGPVMGGFLYVANVRLPYLVAAGLLAVAAVAISLVQPIYRGAPEAVASEAVETELGSGRGRRAG